VIGTCSLIANLVFGVLWDQISVNAAFQYSLVMSSAAIIGLIAFMIVKPNL
jgi:hypothetical protein